MSDTKTIGNINEAWFDLDEITLRGSNYNVRAYASPWGMLHPHDEPTEEHKNMRSIFTVIGKATCYLYLSRQLWQTLKSQPLVEASVADDLVNTAERKYRKRGEVWPFNNSGAPQ